MPISYLIPYEDTSLLKNVCPVEQGCANPLIINNDLYIIGGGYSNILKITVFNLDKAQWIPKFIDSAGISNRVNAFIAVVAGKFLLVIVDVIIYYHNYYIILIITLLLFYYCYNFSLINCI